MAKKKDLTTRLFNTMTPAQAEAMDAVVHMTALELKQFAEMLIVELELKIKREATNRALHNLKLKQLKK